MCYFCVFLSSVLRKARIYNQMALTYSLNPVPQIVVSTGNVGLTNHRAVNHQVVCISHSCCVVIILKLGRQQRQLHVINLMRARRRKHLRCMTLCLALHCMHTHTQHFSRYTYLDIRQKVLLPLECRSQQDYWCVKRQRWPPRQSGDSPGGNTSVASPPTPLEHKIFQKMTGDVS